jgi:hypothetical protein
MTNIAVIGAGQAAYSQPTICCAEATTSPFSRTVRQKTSSPRPPRPETRAATRWRSTTNGSSTSPTDDVRRRPTASSSL